MKNRIGPRLSRRTFLLGTGLPVIHAGLFAGPASSASSVGSQAGPAVLKASDLGLLPDPRKDQTLLLQQALKEAARKQAWLQLDDGDYLIGDLELYVPVRLQGGKRTRLLCGRRARYLFHIESGHAALRNLEFQGQDGGYGQDPLISVRECPELSISQCAFLAFDGNGLELEKCKGTVERSRFERLAEAAIFSLDGQGLRILSNTVKACENNGILVWQSGKHDDGSLIADNDITDINNRSGGDGPFGNGINVYRAGKVTIRGNRIRNCAYSAIRDNSGDDCNILHNVCEDSGEVAIFIEFEWRRVLVRGNTVKRASAGISATNMDHGARGAIIEDNIIEDVSPRITSVDLLGYGISAEADTTIRNNVVRKASDCGITLGWGRYLQNVTATRNRLEDCTYGIGISVVPGAGRALVTYNTIVRPAKGAIVGFDHARPATGDFLRGIRPPRHILLRGNVVKS